MPDLARVREAAVASVRGGRVCVVDGVRVEELEWQLPYGPKTKARLLLPAGHGGGTLPAVLALHCHGGNKCFGLEKITATDTPPHPLMVEHQATYYSGRAWANELARSGYAVLVHDAFPFASRRVERSDVEESVRFSNVPTEWAEPPTAATTPTTAAARFLSCCASRHSHATSAAARRRPGRAPARRLLPVQH